MSSTAQVEKIKILHKVNFVSQGKGAPVVMIHGLAASLHDWDFLLPRLTEAGYAGYALDLLGHGDSPNWTCVVTRWFGCSIIFYFG